VDCGEIASVGEQPFARFNVQPTDEILQQLNATGVQPNDLSRVVITHLHGDHFDGPTQLVPQRVLVHDDELRAARSFGQRLNRRLARQALPERFDPEPLHLAEARFGAFERSPPITANGTVIAVSTPGHTPGACR
jgi:glyoxylase-like metal-dependent hydrolase (beta-lactamase superfamily II)